MKPKTYEILIRAIEDGISTGYHRAHKHTDQPSEVVMKTEIYTAIMGEIHEVFEFEPVHE